MKYKIYLLNFSNYSNKKYSKFISNFVDDRDFSNFMRGTRQRRDWTKGFTVIFKILFNKIYLLKLNLNYFIVAVSFFLANTFVEEGLAPKADLASLFSSFLSSLDSFLSSSLPCSFLFLKFTDYQAYSLFSCSFFFCEKGLLLLAFPPPKAAVELFSSGLFPGFEPNGFDFSPALWPPWPNGFGFLLAPTAEEFWLELKGLILFEPLSLGFGLINDT